MATLDTVLKEVVELTDQSESNMNAVIVSDAEIISFHPSSALLFMTLREAPGLNIFKGANDFRPYISVNTHNTRTIVIKTTDGGENWRLTLNSEKGSLTKEEIFFLTDENNKIRHLWFMTHWDIAASFSTLYWTTDFGETWQESDTINEFLSAKGHVSFSFSEGLKFKNENEGIVIARGLGEVEKEDPIYFLQTTDRGNSWKEIKKLPYWYLSFGQSWREDLTYNNFWKVERNKSISSMFSWSISKSFGTFDILKSQNVIS